MNELDELFEKFWFAGMVKQKKKKAKQLFIKALKKEGRNEAFTAELIEDVRLRLKACQFGFDGMHPTTYLNQERWTDEIPEARNDSHKQPNQTHAQRQHQQAADAYKQMELEHTESDAGIIRQVQRSLR
tara:strand:+ start:768 stop:1154 length:387 start_codon:yes stop_codon:yes gene_type:complete